jgi:hypothetical protein
MVIILFLQSILVTHGGIALNCYNQRSYETGAGLIYLLKGGLDVI